uniref:Polynucleotide 5'-hydroxyl-kinase NOL9 n=1 Tax=Anopheles epiroticus TaxID=199890 RepID=A0A182P821_9DIPT
MGSDASDDQINCEKVTNKANGMDASKKGNSGNVAQASKASRMHERFQEPRIVPVVQYDSVECDSMESDSDEEDYIAQFFDDSSEGEGTNGSKGMKDTPKSKPKKREKKAPETVSSGGWVVENNDCSLEYASSEEEEKPTPKPTASGVKRGNTPKTNGPKKPVVAFKRKSVPMLDMCDGFVPYDSGSDWYDDEDYDDDYGDDDDDMDYGCGDYYDDYLAKGYDSDSFDEALGLNGRTYASDSYDDEYTSDDSLRSPTYRTFKKGEPVDTDSDDEDYEPDSKERDDTVYIPRGAAVMHDLDDDSIFPFHESRKNFTHIVELPADYCNDPEESEPEEPGKLDEKKMEAEEQVIGDKKDVEKMADEEKTGKEKSDEEKADKEKSDENTMDEENANDKVDAKEELDGEESDGSCPTLVEICTKSTLYRFYDSIDLRMSLVVLKAPLYVYGHLSVQALFGKVDILGYQLDMAETRTVYASAGYNAINLSPLPSPDSYSKATFERILNKLKRHFKESDIQELMGGFNPVDSALVLLRADSFAENNTVPMVCKQLPDFELFPTTLTINQSTSSFRTTEALLEVSLFEPTQPNAKNPVPQFQPNPAWDAVELNRTSRLIVVGGKNSGKSTLCQFLLNRYIKQFGRVLLLDLDIGQPLLFVPETLSVSVVENPILGVGCFANVQPRKCQLFGSLNVVSSPLVYIQNVRTLVQYCNENPELKDMPWIINAMGYVVGFGEELTMAVLRLVQPTDLVQLTYPKGVNKTYSFVKADNYANQLTAAFVNGYRFNILLEEVQRDAPPASFRFYPFDVVYQPSRTSFLPPKRRTIAIMARLASILGGSAETFTDVKPHVANLDDLSIISTSDDANSKEMMKRALNASLVYLCEKLDNGQYNCFGVGIVRSVDENNVYLLHSLAQEQLAKTNVLALGNTSLPHQVYLQCSPKIEGTIPYLQNMSDGGGEQSAEGC